VSSKVFVIEIIGSVRKKNSGVGKKGHGLLIAKPFYWIIIRQNLNEIYSLKNKNNSQKGQTIDCTLSQYPISGL